MTTALGRLVPLVITTALTAGLTQAGPASAGAPLRDTQSQVRVVECTPTADGVHADLNAIWVDAGEADSSLTLLGSDGEVIAHDQGYSAQWDGATLSGELLLVVPGSEATGSARFALSLVPDGEPTRETARGRWDNATVREIVVRQPMRVAAGTITALLPGRPPLVLDATGCAGGTSAVTTFVAQPDTTVQRLPMTIDATCTVTNADGARVVLDLDAEGSAMAFLVVEHGADITAGFGTLSWDGPPEAVAGTVPLERRVADDEWQPAGVATLDLTSEKTGQTRYEMVFSGGRDRVASTFFRLAGTVTVDGYAPFFVDACDGMLQTALNRRSSPTRSAPGGPVPADDTPVGAKPLAVGASGDNAQTGATAPDAEVPMSCAVDVPAGHTLWRRMTGTGGPITVDPAGSSFNTVVAVYASDGAGLVEVGCADDIVGDPYTATTHAPVTVDTVAGAVYYVQAGGFAAQHGRLRLTASAG